MADPTNTASLPAEANAEAYAPNSLAGWAKFQRSVNVVIPLRLRELNTLLADARAALSGRVG